MTAPSRSVLFVGSDPLGSASEVFEVIGTRLGAAAHCIPDGETGWINWYTARLGSVEGLEVIAERVTEAQGSLKIVHRTYRLKSGWKAADLELSPIGYCQAAAESYEAFKQARRRPHRS